MAKKKREFKVGQWVKFLSYRLGDRSPYLKGKIQKIEYEFAGVGIGFKKVLVISRQGVKGLWYRDANTCMHSRKNRK